MKESQHKEIGERVKLARIEKGWSQVELAAKLGLNNSSLISAYESGRTAIPVKTIAKMSVLFKQDLNYLILGNRDITDLNQAIKAVNSLQNLIMVRNGN